MSAQSPGSYTASVLLHGAIVAALFGASWVMHKEQVEPTKIFDVVAGAGDNWDATEAPALGSPDGDEGIKMPNVPQPIPRIDDPSPPVHTEVAPPPEPEPSPVEPAPMPKEAPKPKPVEKAVEKSPLDAKKTTFAQDFKRLQDKRYNKKIEQFRKQKKAEEERARKEAAKRMSEEEFKRQNAGKTGGGGRVAKIDAKGIAGGVVGGSTKNTKGGAGGTALSAAEASQMERYFAYLKRQLKGAHIPPPGAGDQLSSEIEFFCAADGTLSRIKVVRSSGNEEFDQSVVEAFRRVKGIGARPDGQGETLVLEFKARED